MENERSKYKWNGANLVKLTIECPNIGEVEIDLKSDPVDWSAKDIDSETYGNYGHIDLSFRCKCGRTHDMEVHSW